MSSYASSQIEIAITGRGIVSSIGEGADAFVDALLERRVTGPIVSTPAGYGAVASSSCPRGATRHPLPGYEERWSWLERYW